MRGRERSNAFAMRLMCWIALGLGRRAARIFLHPICLYFLVFSLKARRASREYLLAALGRPPSLADRYRHYHAFASVALDRIFLLRNRFESFEIRVRGEAILLEILGSGEGCFLLGAHFGSFEALRSLGREKQVKVSMVMFEQGTRNMNALARALDPELEQAVIGLGTPDSMIALHERLERGEWVGMLGDRGLYRSGSVTVPFFGRPAAFPTAPFRIASMFGRPVILMLGIYCGGNRYELQFERLIEAPRLDRANRDEAIREWAARYAGRLEHYCRMSPYNWFNFYDFWADADAR
jgi:predicted LPLAT superfamily acyltransferase